MRGYRLFSERIAHDYESAKPEFEWLTHFDTHLLECLGQRFAFGVRLDFADRAAVVFLRHNYHRAYRVPVRRFVYPDSRDKQFVFDFRHARTLTRHKHEYEHEREREYRINP